MFLFFWCDFMYNTCKVLKTLGFLSHSLVTILIKIRDSLYLLVLTRFYKNNRFFSIFTPQTLQHYVRIRFQIHSGSYSEN